MTLAILLFTGGCSKDFLEITPNGELGQEGHRFYDLQRWDQVISDLTRILEFEKNMPWGDFIYSGAAPGPEDVNFPIPQRQIDLSHGKLVQNR